MIEQERLPAAIETDRKPASPEVRAIALDLITDIIIAEAPYKIVTTYDLDEPTRVQVLDEVQHIWEGMMDEWHRLQEGTTP